eukprot:3083653-Rhodomonas_salina.2
MTFVRSHFETYPSVWEGGSNISPPPRKSARELPEIFVLLSDIGREISSVVLLLYKWGVARLRHGTGRPKQHLLPTAKGFWMCAQGTPNSKSTLVPPPTRVQQVS